MKKYLILLFGLLLILCGCGNKKEYKLIELSSSELFNHMLAEDASIVIAVYSETDNRSDAFLKDLEKTAKQAKENVYYIDIDHLDVMNALVYDQVINLEGESSLKYMVYQNGNLIVNEAYTDFDTMFHKLNGKKYDDVEVFSDEDRQFVVDQAIESYEKGNISEAYDHLNLVWNYEPAKKLYKEWDLLNIINGWESFSITKDNKSERYIGMQFLPLNNILYMVDIEEKLSKFEKPTIDDYKVYYFNIKDNIICISEEVYGKCSMEYELVDLRYEHMTLRNNDILYEFNLKDGE